MPPHIAHEPWPTALGLGDFIHATLARLLIGVNDGENLDTRIRQECCRVSTTPGALR